MLQNTQTFGQAFIAALALATTGSVGLGADAQYYVNDPLATTVAIADSAGEIAAMETDAFGAPLAIGEAPGRFTGKPYDADLGAYVFPFRNYRPEEGRWMSADPSGFPDGVNGRVYGASLFSELDPLGLVITVVGGSSILVDAARDYIRSTPVGKNTWDHLANSTHDWKVDVGGGNPTDFDPSTRTINWDPTQGVRDRNGAKISPATGLLHELAHAVGFDVDPSGFWDRVSQKDPIWGDMEEKRVIETVENVFARAKNEGVRSTHFGTFFTTTGVLKNE